MKREVYEKQKAFADAKTPSMLRRCVGHDYTERQMYMVTMVVECLMLNALVPFPT